MQTLCSAVSEVGGRGQFSALSRERVGRQAGRRAGCGKRLRTFSILIRWSPSGRECRWGFDRGLAECVRSGPVELRVWPHLVLAIFRLYPPDRIDFDVDLRELQGQGTLCGLTEQWCRSRKRVGSRSPRRGVLGTGARW